MQSKRADDLERRVKVLEKTKGGPAPSGLVKELEAAAKREADANTK